MILFLIDRCPVKFTHNAKPAAVNWQPLRPVHQRHLRRTEALENDFYLVGAIEMPNLLSDAFFIWFQPALQGFPRYTIEQRQLSVCVGSDD